MPRRPPPQHQFVSRRPAMNEQAKRIDFELTRLCTMIKQSSVPSQAFADAQVEFSAFLDREKLDVGAVRDFKKMFQEQAIQQVTGLDLECRKRIESAITSALNRLDATPLADHDLVISRESESLAELLNKEGINQSLAEAMLEKMKEMSRTRQDLRQSEKQLEIIRGAEKSMFSRGFARSALGSRIASADDSEDVFANASMVIEQKLPVSTNEHGPFSMEHAAIRTFSDEETRDATMVKALSKLAGLNARERGFVIDRSVLEEAEMTVKEALVPGQSNMDLAMQPRGLEASRKIVDAVAEKMGTDAAGLKKMWQQDYDDLCNWARALAKQWAAPPLEHLVSASNMETFAMAAIHFMAARADRLDGTDEEMAVIWDGVCARVPEFDRVALRVSDFLNLVERDDNEFVEFAWGWRGSSYARLEVGHKLAASLCLTDTDGVDVVAPWEACSIVVPDGLLDAEIPGGDPRAGDVVRFSRIWCLGTEPVFWVAHDGSFLRIRPIDDTDGKMERNLKQAVINLVRGAFLAIANPEEFKKKTTSSSSSLKKNNRQGPPDLSQAKYMISAPISIDFRDMLHEHLSGKRKSGGGAPTVQFLVRGHWRQQPVGARDIHPIRRKTLWIQPFWKGPPESRVLLRSHKIKEE